MMYKLYNNYQHILSLAIKYNCKLITSEQEIKKTSYIFLIGKCGHKTKTTPNQFCKYKSGVLCDNCTNKISSEPENINLICSNPKCNITFIPSIKSFLYCSKFCKHSRPQSDITKTRIANTVINTCKNKPTNLIQNSIILFDLHTFGNKYIRELFRYKIDIELSNRKSTHNLIIKPSLINDDNWFPIEIKYSDIKIDDNYFFAIKKTYHNIYIILAYITEKKYWIIPPNKIKTKTRLKVNSFNRFSEYLVEENNLINHLLKIYTDNPTLYINNTIGIIPENIDCHAFTELKYIKLRKEKINFLNFEKPISNFLTYNFLINNFRIQESVGFINKNDKYQNIMTTMRKSIGKKKFPYEYDDNDFYWFNEPNEDTFYVVSRDVLRDKGFIQHMANIGKINLNITKNQIWLNEHKFSYNTIGDDMEQKLKLLSLFNRN